MDHSAKEADFQKRFASQLPALLQMLKEFKARVSRPKYGYVTERLPSPTRNQRINPGRAFSEYKQGWLSRDETQYENSVPMRVLRTYYMGKVTLIKYKIEVCATFHYTSTYYWFNDSGKRWSGGLYKPAETLDALKDQLERHISQFHR